jgi:DNA (cytosine-5)-methyltransferase 1
MEKEMTLGSLFDGIAGFPLAAAQNGIKTIWASEIVGDCIDIVKKHFPEIQHLGDITKINGGEIPPVDIISFGSPCQNLSTAGNQKGLDGEKSQLFFEAIRIIYEMRGATNGKYPKYIIWENVAGAFSSNKGQDFRRVLEEITKTYIPMPNSRRWATSGMVRSAAGSTAWRQLDAQYWGVPQRRKRIYLVHNFNGERAPEILFECESVLGYTAQGRTEGKNIAGSAGNSVEATGTGTAAGFLPLNSGRANGVGYEDEKSPTLTKNPPATVYTIAGNAIGRMGRNGGNQLGVGQDISYTLTAADRHAIAAPEAFRLSSFGGFAEGVGTLRASGGDNGGGSETMIVEKNLQFAEAYQHHGYRMSKTANTMTAGANSSVRGDTSFVIENNVVCFDDVVKNEDGGYWACICKDCVKKHNISENLLDDAGQGTCSVAGCWNEADYYIDFPQIEEPKEGQRFWKIAKELLQKVTKMVRYRVRRLTPLECERLDGFPDNWTEYGASGKEMSDKTRYEALGNSIAVPCADRVFAGIIAAEKNGGQDNE